MIGKDGIQVEEGTAAHNNPMEMLPTTGDYICIHS